MKMRWGGCVGMAIGLVPLLGQRLPEPPKEDPVERRMEWFYEHRRNAAGEVGAAARGEALRAAERMMAAQKATRRAAGPRWKPIGPQPTTTQSGNFILGGRVNAGGPYTAGRVSALAVDPRNGDVVYVGAASGGVWKSTDGGQNWFPLTDDAPSLAIGSLALDPQNPDIVYAGTGEQTFSGSSYYGAGILKSIDGGQTWTHLPGRFVGPFGPAFSFGTGGARIGSLAVNRRDPRVLLAGVHTGLASSSGIHRSSDGGETWDVVFAGGSGTEVFFDAANPDVAWAAIGTVTGGALNGVYRSADAGRTWTPFNGSGAAALPVRTAGRVEIAQAPTAPNVLVAGLARADVIGPLLGLFRSTDGGQSWQQLPAPDYCNPQCWYNHTLLFHPRNPNILTAGGINLWRSANGGLSWADISLSANGIGVHVDHHAQAYTPDAAKFYSGNDGGVWSTPRMDTGQLEWTNLNQTLNITQFYPGLSIHPDTPDIAYGGTQDNGFQRYTAERGWEYATCGDGGWSAIDFAVPGNVYGTCFDISPLKSMAQSNYRGFLLMLSGISGANRVAFIPPLVMDPNNPQRLYFGTQRLYQSNDGGGQWTAVSDDLALPNGVLRAIAPAPSDPRVVWVGTQQGFVHVTNNAHQPDRVQWTDRSMGLPRRIATQIAVHPHDPKTAYVAFAGFRGAPGPDGTIFKTTDQGESWASVGEGFPNTPVNDLFIDPDLPDTVYAASDVGVFRTRDGGANWEPLMDGLPRVVVMAVKMHRPSRTLRVATHGRGMWDLVLPLPEPSRAPGIQSVEPATLNRQHSPVTLTVRGEQFSTGTVARWNGEGRRTRIVSATELTVSLEGKDTASAGRNTLMLYGPAPGAGLSKAVNVPVGPAPAVAGVSDIAAPTTRLVPGSMASVFGENLAQDTHTGEPSLYSLAGSNFIYPLPYTLGGVTVELAGEPVPLQFVSPNQINFQVPWGWGNYRGADLVITNGTWRSPAQPLRFSRFAPSLFSLDGRGAGQALAVIQGADGALAAPAGTAGNARPVRRGEVLEVLGSGFGLVTRVPSDGIPFLSGPLSLATPPVVTIGGTRAVTRTAFLVPNLVGVYQANVEVPIGARSGPAVPLVAAIDGEISNIVTIAIE